MRLYHATFSSNLDSIRKSGIEPNHPTNWPGYDEADKVYFAFDPSTAVDYLKESERYHGQSIAVLEVDTKDMDFSRVEYDWNVHCEYYEDINSLAYCGTVKRFAVLPDDDFDGYRRCLIDVGEDEDEDAGEIYDMLSEAFDNEVESNRHSVVHAV